MIKERPILYADAMVRAILDDRKKLTRRGRGLELVNVDPDGWALMSAEQYGTDGNPYVAGWDRRKCEISVAAFVKPDGGPDDFKLCACPYGKPGDRLWVRECWGESGLNRYEYRASPADGSDFRSVSRWRPSIHMPRAVSRISLEITDIRVERLNDISAEDALAEGIVPSGRGSSVYDFRLLWESISGEGSWVKNPWVWVVEFKRIEGGVV